VDASIHRNVFVVFVQTVTAMVTSLLRATPRVCAQKGPTARFSSGGPPEPDQTIDLKARPYLTIGSRNRSGLLRRKTTLQRAGYPLRTRSVGVHFKPWGLAPFLPMPAAELCDRPVTVEQVWGRPAIAELRDRLATATDRTRC
jgi:hypothetical protein